MRGYFFYRRKRKVIACMVFLTVIILALNAIILDDSSTVFNPFLSEHQRNRRLLAERYRHYQHYQQMEHNRTGPGEMGTPVKLTESEEKLVKEEIKKEGMSAYLNSLVSLERSLTDHRPERCKEAQYPKNLPTLSVVIIFCNELLHVVLRNVHSVINRTPPKYLHEIILVDDASVKAELREPLDNYTRAMWPDGLVKVIHLNSRQGLIRTRLVGVHAATGDVIAVMDGHMEVSPGWAEPLLARIKQNNRTLLVPTIDAINSSDLKYINMSMTSYQTFKWDLQFAWMELSDPKKHDPLEPIETSGIVGCVFVMHRETFLEMGALDPGMNYWGVENTELPIRIWMCGGRVEVIPCSRIAHTYRIGARPWNSTEEDYMGKNGQRAAEVWMDDFKSEFYLIRDDRVGKTDYGNITDRLELRKRLGCKSFQWFLENVVKPPKALLTINVTAWGMVKNGVGAMCLDTLTHKDSGPVGIYPCHSPRGNNQLFSLNWDKEIRKEFACLEYPLIKEPGHNVTMYYGCQNIANTRVWEYDPPTARIVNQVTGFCLDAAGYKGPDRIYVVLNPCSGVESQKWIWENYVGRKEI